MSLTRKTGLRSDPAKTRAWQDRSRGSLRVDPRDYPPFQIRQAPAPADARDPQANARAALRRSSRKRRARVPAATRARVYARSDGLCVCGCGRKADHLHHVLRVEKSDWAHLELVEQIMVGMYHDCHWAHEAALPRLPYERLPRLVIDYVHGLGPRAEAELERYHPRTAGRGRAAPGELKGGSDGTR